MSSSVSKSNSGNNMGYEAAMSSSTNYALFVIAKQMCGNGLFFFQWRDSEYTWVLFQEPVYVTYDDIVSIISCGGRFYYITSWVVKSRRCSSSLNHEGMSLYVIDAIGEPEAVIGFVGMDQSQLLTIEEMEIVLVESDEVLVVVKIPKDDVVSESMEFQVFRADLSKKMWVRMRTLGGRVLVCIRNALSISLRAADLGVRGNCINCSKLTQWQVFDSGIRRVTDEPVEFPSPFAHLMFMSSIY